MNLLSRFATSALVGLMLASLALPNAHATPIIPNTVDPSTVLVGAFHKQYTSAADAGDPDNWSAVYANALDSSFLLTVPGDRWFSPGLSPTTAVVKSFDAFFSGKDVDLPFLATVAQFDIAPGTVFDASNTFFVDLTPVNAVVHEAINNNGLDSYSLFADILFPAVPFLTDQTGFDAYVQSVVELAEANFALQPDDPGLLTTLASLPTTYSPSVSPVPEIDPAGMGSVVALVTGTLGLLERRRLKAKVA